MRVAKKRKAIEFWHMEFQNPHQKVCACADSQSPSNNLKTSVKAKAVTAHVQYLKIIEVARSWKITDSIYVSTLTLYIFCILESESSKRQSKLSPQRRSVKESWKGERRKVGGWDDPCDLIR